MRLVFVAMIGVLLLLAPVGLVLAAIVFRLGLERSYEIYGPAFTVIAALGLLPCLLAIGFLFDKRQSPPQK